MEKLFASFSVSQLSRVRSQSAFSGIQFILRDVPVDRTKTNFQHVRKTGQIEINLLQLVVVARPPIFSYLKHKLLINFG